MKGKKVGHKIQKEIIRGVKGNKEGDVVKWKTDD